ncbi:MAG: hypothetical protein K2W96_04165, partial [Gemmataceae bacterium]|nr:hypothetical protein [Gemmataceae bacterium]
KRVVRLAQDGAATVHDMETGKELSRLPRYFVLEYRSEGRYRGEIKLRRLKHPVVQYSPNGKTLLIAGISFGPGDPGDRLLHGDRTAILLYDVDNDKTRTIAFPLRHK